MRAAADVLPFLEAVAADSGDALPYGIEAEPTPSTWTDQWSWNASGVPTVTTSAGGPEYDRYYHTDLENKTRVDHDYLGGIAKWNHRVIQGLDEGVLPYDLRARGDQLLGTIQPGKLVRAGVSEAAATRFKTAATKFRAAAWQWELRKAKTPKGKVVAVNEKLIALEKTVNATFTSRDQYDFTAYPHEAGTTDAIYLTKAITAARTRQRGAGATDDQLVGRHQLVREPVQRRGLQAGPGAPLPGPTSTSPGARWAPRRSSSTASTSTSCSVRATSPRPSPA